MELEKAHTEIWNEALESLQQDLPLHSYNTWVKPLHLKAYESDRIVVEVPNSYYRARLQEQYAPLLRSKLRQVFKNNSIDVAFVLPESRHRGESLLRDLSITRKEIREVDCDARRPSSPVARYTFSTFVVGAGNQFAHAASRATAQAPGQTYNPLFIYGGVGLGKTHLLCAIGNQIRAEQPSLRVLYRTAENFVNEVIQSLRFQKMAEFRTRYRESCDVLLIDDIQFLGGKERTQEEFFYTFNTLYEARKQIVLTSDMYPKEIPDLNERLRSRFQCGLFADIQPPDIETRVAILRRKAEADCVVLPDDVALFLAKNVTSNIRVLEGALIRLAAFSSISGRSITLELTREIFSSLAPEDRALSVESIQKCVADFFHLNISDLRSARRHRVVALPRQVAMYLSRKLTSSSFPELGEKFGGKDHSTVMHAVQKIERLLPEDSVLRTSVGVIEQTLQTQI